ncbi:MAG: TerC family protein [Pirellulaceae bacterium]
MFLELFTPGNLFTLAMLILLQAVLGFDNLLYISIESKRVEESKQSYVRKLGIGFAIILRILLLVVVVMAIERLQEPFVSVGIEKVEQMAQTEGHRHAAEGAITDYDTNKHKDDHGQYRLTDSGNIFAAALNMHSVIVLLGGMFIIYTAFKEIFHLLAINHLEHEGEEGKKRSVGAAIFWIMTMNLVFSFDSILSAIALTDNVWVMAIAIIISGVLMMVLADHVAEFLKRNRMYEVLGLFILLLVGVMLVSKGAHLAHMHILKYEIAAMSKATFYFVIFIMVVIDIVQGSYQKKLLAQSERELAYNTPATEQAGS